MLQLIIGAAVLVALFYYIAIRPMSYWKNLGIKQSSPKWLVGDNFGTLFKTESFAGMVKRLYNQCPEATRYFGMYQFTLPTLMIKDPDLLKQITVKDFEYFMDHRVFIPEDADPLWGKNLFALTGQRWKNMRPILSPSFTSSKMRSMFVLMSECSETFVKHFLDKNDDVTEIEMKDMFTRFTNDVIATTAFGVKVDSLAKPKNDFYLMGKSATDFSGIWKNLKFFGYMVIPGFFKFFKIGLFEKSVSHFFIDLINDTVKTREEKHIVRPDVIHLLMEARKGIQQKEESNVPDTGFATVQEADLGKAGGAVKEITNLDITAQALIFFFAGFDTVSSLMCFMAYELAVNPDIQTRLRQEIRETLDECNGKLTYEALLKMKYMDMVVSETLRKWPGAIAVDRICTKPYTIEPTLPGEKPVHIKKGTVMWLPIIAIHNDPKFYPNPDKFDPERFSEENKGDINPYAYLPFGLGPRNCIGSRFALLENKTVMFHILRHFEFVPTGKSRIPLTLSKRSFNLLAEGGFWFGLKRVKN
ncbi:unnamed protein product [Phaedon cochleariae]|uniref:Cytochrome P450 n=1 Tax=Phaedon cochleariae TaxID=80249 RepID=A0A9N9X522_PHACE|nr:unnamed protein product [Phaedon cochleariae]